MKVINDSNVNAKVDKRKTLDHVLIKRGYYFHSDDDFREDRNWGTKKADSLSATSKAVKNQSL